MSTHTNNPMTPTPDEQLDLLISRIADGEASASDWDSFNTLASHRTDAWKHLAQAQREHQSLSLAVGVALHAADRVEMPSRDAADAFLRRSHPERFSTWSRVRQAGGWATAAMIALAWIGANRGQFTIGSGSHDKTNEASLIPAGYYKVTSPDDALQLYRDQCKPAGRMIAEVPVLLESRQNATGQGFEVVFVRQIVEKAQVENLMRFAQDEAGRPIPVRVTVTGRTGQTE